MRIARTVSFGLLGLLLGLVLGAAAVFGVTSVLGAVALARAQDVGLGPLARASYVPGGDGFAVEVVAGPGAGVLVAVCMAVVVLASRPRLRGSRVPR